jgi:hypothetical protein
LCSSDETSESCPADCSGKELGTTYDFNLGSSSVIFTVNALRDVFITSLAINAMARGNGRVMVYTRDGEYSNAESSSDGWTLVYDKTVFHQPRGLVTELGEFNSGVIIGAGTSKSFYIESTKKLVYKSGTEELAPYSSDGVLAILEGIGLNNNFTGPVYTPRVWSGKIRQVE